MKIRAKRSELLNELSYIIPIVEKSAKSAKMPILSHILLRADGPGNPILLAGSDMDLSVTTTCAAEVDEPGGLAVPAKEFSDIIRLMPDKTDISINSDVQDRIVIQSGKARFKLVFLPDETFPEIPEMKGTPIQIPADILRKMLQMTVFSTSFQEQARFTLNGVLIVINRNYIKMVSTDGHRMSYVETTKHFETIDNEIKIIIPKKTVGELLKLLQGSRSEVTFTHDDNRLFFRFENKFLVSRMLAGQFPNFDMVIPRNLVNHIKLDVGTLKEAILRANILTDVESKRVLFRLEKDSLVLRSENQSRGEAEEDITVSFQGDPTELGFNSQYLLEFLNVLEVPEVSFDFTGPQSPSLFRPVNELDFTYKYVVMPMSM